MIGLGVGLSAAPLLTSEANEKPARAKSQKIYRTVEIAKHNTPESLWVHYEGTEVILFIEQACLTLPGYSVVDEDRLFVVSDIFVAGPNTSIAILI